MSISTSTFSHHDPPPLQLYYMKKQKKPPDFQVDDVSSLPVQVDWVKEGKLAPVVNQGGCGSCWTFAATATIESHLAIETGDDPVPLSEQNMLQCAPNPDDCGGKLFLFYCYMFQDNMKEDLEH